MKSPRGSGARRTREGALLAAVWLTLALCAGTAALPGMQRLGMYYDEAFLAQQARGFIEPERAGSHPASVRSVTIRGRPFPLRNAAYLGSLKSQLLIPLLALAGSTPLVVRLGTLATGLLGLLFCMLFAARVCGLPLALLTGLLVVCDPSFFFYSQFEWGPFTTNLLCRGSALWLLSVAWQNPGRRLELPAAAGAGALMGLGIYSRADFVLIAGTCVLALALVRRDLLARALRERRPLLVSAGLALLILSSPMWMAVAELWSTGSSIGQRGDLWDKARVFWQTLDGSRFYRVLDAGGVFERTFVGEAPSSPFALAVVAAWSGLALLARRPTRELGHGHSGTIPFLLWLCPLLAAATLLLPGAVRAHHHLNLLPFGHMLVAAAVLACWRARRRVGSAPGAAKVLPRAFGLLLVCVILAGNLITIARSEALIAQTGGRGRWSHALNDFARGVDAMERARVVSLDWGFHEPLLFQTDRAELWEPIWAIPQRLRSGRPWRFDGDEHTLYLVHDARYDLFGFGPDFLASAGRLKNQGVRIETHRDAAGEAAFYSVRIPYPHRIVYGGHFGIFPLDPGRT